VKSGLRGLVGACRACMAEMLMPCAGAWATGSRRACSCSPVPSWFVFLRRITPSSVPAPLLLALQELVYRHRGLGHVAEFYNPPRK
jgi:hypothetical protein